MIERIVPLATAIIAVVYWSTVRKRNVAPPPPRLLEVLLFALPALFAIQLVPLPAAVVGIVSPARLALQQAAARVTGPIGGVPLSAVPSATVTAVLMAASCVLILLLVRELAWRSGQRPWLAAAPLIVLAAFEAALGLAQPQAHGTYVNRDHFAALLAACLPFPIAWGISTLSADRALPVRTVLRACLLFSLPALMLAAIIHSASRAGFLAALLGVAVVVGRGRLLPGALLAAAAGLFLLPTGTLVGRFAALHRADESALTRVRIWRESLALVHDYPLFGCGLGAYESVMTRYKAAAPLYTVDFAHNDYLQLAAEAGAIGFVPSLLAVVLIVRSALRGSRSLPAVPHTYLAAACLGSLATLLLTAFFDFGLHMPLSALAAAWVCGLATTPNPAV